MKALTSFVFLLIVSFYLGQKPNKNWTLEEITAANTADTVTYLGVVEKEVILFLNLARMYPQRFKELELKGYYGTKKYGDYLKGSSWIVSLDSLLDTLQPLAPVLPDSVVTAYAKCFAIEMGDAGTTGHERINCPTEKQYGECSSFGMDNGKDIVLQMLIDHNIPNVGHRTRCLNSAHVIIGVHLHTHKEWGQCCVMDFVY